MKKTFTTIIITLVIILSFINSCKSPQRSAIIECGDKSIKLDKEVIIQPGRNNFILLNTVKLSKGKKYLISVTGKIKPELKSINWGGCSENTIKRIFNCSVRIINPFDNNKVIQEVTIPTFERLAPHFSDWQNCCESYEQFQSQFIFESSNQSRIFQIDIVNNDSEISYHHECPPGQNKIGGFKFPVEISGDTRIEISCIKN